LFERAMALFQSVPRRVASRIVEAITGAGRPEAANFARGALKSPGASAQREQAGRRGASTPASDRRNNGAA